MVLDASSAALSLEQCLLRLVPRLGAERQHVAVTLTRLLALGQPIACERLAEATSLPVGRTLEALAGLKSVTRDRCDRLQSCCGLSVVDTPNVVYVAGRRLFAWCAWDALMLPQILGRTLRAISRCPVTDEAISIEVEPDGLGDLVPSSSAMSFVLPDPAPERDAFESFCRHVRFFGSRESATRWTSERESLFVLSIAEGHRLARSVARQCFPAVPLDRPARGGEPRPGGAAREPAAR